MNCTRLFRAAMYRVGFWLVLVALGVLLVPGLVAPVYAGTFGLVVPIGGQASDIALDDPRGLLYIANFTANRIDVMSLSDNTVNNSIQVGPQPGSLALSPDGTYLVVAHFGNFVSPGTPANALTVISLRAGNSERT